MKLLLIAFALAMIAPGCTQENKEANCKHPETRLDFEEMGGHKIDTFIKEFGVPDEIGPVSDYSSKFAGMDKATVVMRYKSLRRDVYVKRDCTILIVVTGPGPDHD